VARGWFGDATTLREYPPLRAAWAKRGQPANVVLSGRNGRRVLHGALNAASGELVQVIRERSRQDDCLAFIEELGTVRPEVPKLLIWDHAPRRTIRSGSWRRPPAPTSRLPGCPFAPPSSIPARTFGA
jgi:hypothetical protein